MERKCFPVAVHLFLLDGEKILLLKRHNTGYEDGNYSVVAGQVMHRKEPRDERIDYFFECRKWSGKITNMEQDKCSELKWFAINDLPDNTIEFIAFAIKNYLAGIPFTLFDW